jgi:hypothetical protein
MVTFARPLVTEIYERPATTAAEKKVLFYTDTEYRDFRLDYLRNKRDTVVQFADVVVTDVHEYPCAASADELYYSEKDLQRFLDEFIQSLNAGFP